MRVYKQKHSAIEDNAGGFADLYSGSKVSERTQDSERERERERLMGAGGKCVVL